MPVNDPERHKSLSFIDRFCRTLRTLLERHMDREEMPGQWAKELEACIANYNDSVGRASGKTPKQLVEEGAAERELDRQRVEVKRRHQTNRAARHATPTTLTGPLAVTMLTSGGNAFTLPTYGGGPMAMAGSACAQFTGTGSSCVVTILQAPNGGVGSQGTNQLLFNTAATAITNSIAICFTGAIPASTAATMVTSTTNGAFLGRGGVARSPGKGEHAGRIHPHPQDDDGAYCHREDEQSHPKTHRSHAVEYGRALSPNPQHAWMHHQLGCFDSPLHSR